MFDRPRNIASAIHNAAKKMRQKYPDNKLFSSAGPDPDYPGLIKVSRSDWPEGVTISIPTGGKYAGQSQDGADVIAGYEKGRRGMPFLRGLVGGARRSGGTTPPVWVDVEAWAQSNQGAGQNASGGLISAGLYVMDPPSVIAWDLPTSEEEGLKNEGLKPFGLVYYPEGETAVFASAWPQQRESDGNIQICMGAWSAATKENQWLWKEGAYYVPAVSYQNQESPSYNLFYVAAGEWLFVVPTTTNSFGFLNAIYSSRGELGYVARTTGVPGFRHNASIHGWSETVEGEEAPVNQIYCFLPYFDEGPASGAEVVFLKFNEGSASWASHSARTVEDIPAGGVATCPNLLGTGNANALGPPAAWRGNEPLIFVSGGTQDLFSTTKWLNLEWTLRSLNPADGTNGSFVRSKQFTATANAELLDPGSMIAAVNARPHPVYSPEPGIWLGGITHSDPSASELQHFPRGVPVVLPVASPNLGRLETIESRMASDSLGNPQWPLVLENSGGGPVVDEAGTVWVCTLEPVRTLYGGEYVQIDDGTAPAWLYETSIQVFFPEPALPVSGNGYTSELPFSITLGDVLVTLSGPGDEEGDLVRDDEGNILYAYYAGISPGPPLTWTKKKWQWNQFFGCRWKTMLRGYRSGGTMVEQDISQRLDAKTVKNLGRPLTESVEITQSIEVGNNVHQIISFPDKNLIAILRDLHLDGAGNNPTPVIEMYSVESGGLTKRSTVRLGSFDELLATDAVLGSYNTKAGDQQWDPYKYGPPRMKACRKNDFLNTPVIVAMVGEEKKVNSATQSQFRRVCYVTIEYTDPTSPSVTRSARTSEDLGIGSNGYPAGEDYHAPIWDSWDTLTLVGNRVAWIKDSEFREAAVP